ERKGKGTGVGTVIGTNGISIGKVNEGEEMGFTLASPHTYDSDRFPSRSAALGGIFPMAGTTHGPVEATSNMTGTFIVDGGLGVIGNIFGNDGKMASESWVNGRLGDYTTMVMLSN